MWIHFNVFRYCSSELTMDRILYLIYLSQDDDHDCELELEEILNLDTDGERREYALVSLGWSNIGQLQSCVVEKNWSFLSTSGLTHFGGNPENNISMKKGFPLHVSKASFHWHL